jgi:hypothetical protein
MRLSTAIIPAIAIALAAAPLHARPSAKLQAVTTGSRIDVTLNGAFFTSYRFSKDEKYPLLFPVNGPSGASVTSMRNGQYPHHSSLFFGCDKVNGGNYWQEGNERGQILSQGPKIVSNNGPEIVITDVCDWQRPDAAQPFRDTRRIAIRAPSAELREIDFDITLTALEDVVIQKTNHSLFSARMDPDLTPQYGGKMTNAEGQAGEKGTFGKPSPWLACFGPRGGKPEGLAILQHPSNPGYPSPWFTRDYGFLSPTPMFWPEDGKSTRVKKDSSLRLRYRVLIFAGTPESIDIAEKHAEFTKADS